LRRPRRRATTIAVAAGIAVVAVALVGGALCKLVFDCGTGSEKIPPLEVEQGGLVDELIVSGLEQTSTFAFLPGNRVLIGQVNGVVRVVKNGRLLARPFLDLRHRVNTELTRGLVGLEPDPDFARNGQVFLLYAAENGGPADGHKAARLTRVTARGDRADPSSEVVILGADSKEACDGLPETADCIPANGIHVGGGLAFADDGTLFVGTGDGEIGEGLTFEPEILRAQSLDSLGGKILHITRAGKGLPSNPFWTGNPNANRSKVWAFGLRNPFRLTVRPGTDDVYVGDVGWNRFEEVDVARPGANLGWPCYEARARTQLYRDTALCKALYTKGGTTPPLVQWSHKEGQSVTGGAFRRDGEYVYGDFGASWLKILRVDAANRIVPGSEEDLAKGTVSPTQVRIGPHGDVYYLSVTGALHRIRPAAS
jgi:glucose/arabinose dehydrogenase